MSRAQNRNPTTEPENAPPPDDDTDAIPDTDGTPDGGRTRLSRLWEPAVFLLVIMATMVVAVLSDAGTVQALAGAVSAVCAVWQLLRSRRR